MDFKYFLALVGRKKRVVASIVLTFLALATIFLVFSPFKYEASSKVVVTQKPLENESSYAITQSNIRLSQLLAEAVDSSSFFKKVLGSGYGIDEDYFSRTGDSQEMVRKWKAWVEAGVSGSGDGVINIKVYHTDKAQLKRIADAINQVLRTDNSDYHSLGDRVEIRVIDQPMVSDRPTEPNIFLVLALALVLGITVAFSYVYLFFFLPDQEQKRVGDVDGIFPGLGGYSEYSAEKKEGSSRPGTKEKEAERAEAKDEVQDPSIPIIQEDPEKYLSPDDRPSSTPDRDEEGEEHPENKEDDTEEEEIPLSRDRVSPEEVEEKGDIRNIFG